MWGRRESIMHDFEGLSHVRWECKYHVVFILKYRRKLLYGLPIAVRREKAWIFSGCKSRPETGRSIR